MSGPLRVGIVGCGAVAQILHLPALGQLPDRFAVSALCDVNAATLAGVAARLPAARRFADAAALAACSEVDVVLVASPHAHHAEAALAAMAAGKHVLIEKPHCLSLREADALIAAQEKAGVVAQVGYMRRYAPALAEAKALLAEPAAIRHARVQDIIGANALIVDSTSRVVRGGDDPAAVARTRALQETLVADAIGPAPPALATAYMLLLGLASHDVAAMRELIGPPQGVIFAAQRWDGRFLSAAFDYGHFVCQFAAGVDQIGRMDAFLEVDAGTRMVRVEYDTPFVRNLPARLIVTEAKDRVGVSRSDGYATRQDAFVLEWIAFHDAIVSKGAPKTSLADARADLELFAAMIAKMR